MASSSIQNGVTTLELCRVSPAPNSPELTVPITYLDAMWLKQSSVENLFLYQLTDPNPTHFNSVIVPQLKHSLSLTLTHFSLLAGRLMWPAGDDQKPTIVFKPDDEESSFVPLTIAESNNPESFIHLIGSKAYSATESRLYVPELHVTDSEAEALSIQVTLFANHGIAIGFTIHHAVFDGKGVSLFMKAWAHLNNQLAAGNSASLPPVLTPLLDRSVVHDPDALCLKIVDRWDKVSLLHGSGRSLKPFAAFDLNPTLVTATFEVSLEDVRKLRELVLSKLGFNSNLHLSTFVLAFSYALTCLVKALNVECSKTVRLAVPADCRAQMGPPLPENYLGNCLSVSTGILEARVVKGGDGVAAVASSVVELIQVLRDGSVYEALKDRLSNSSGDGRDVISIGVTGSPKLEFYRVDFGWGRPDKVAVTSIDRGGSIFMSEKRDGSEGVEVGLVLTKEEMEVFDCLFVGGLKELKLLEPASFITV